MAFVKCLLLFTIIGTTILWYVPMDKDYLVRDEFSTHIKGHEGCTINYYLILKRRTYIPFVTTNVDTISIYKYTNQFPSKVECHEYQKEFGK
jgi:hypothetical protein